LHDAGHRRRGAQGLPAGNRSGARALHAGAVQQGHGRRHRGAADRGPLCRRPQGGAASVTGALVRSAALGACAMLISDAGAATGFAEGARIWLVEDPATPQPMRRPPLLNTLRDVGIALEICWRANEPPLAQARPGMNVTVMLAFPKTGPPLGEPPLPSITP